MRRLPALSCFLVTLALPIAASAQFCRGDCNEDGSVTVDEIVTAVDIALGSTPPSACLAAAAGGIVDVADILVIVQHALLGCPGSTPLVVDTTAGSVRGSRANGVRSFLGIPYAAPPTGERRWRRPEAHDGWEGTRDATRPGPVCPQRIPFLNSDTGNEDCLFVNVHTPAQGSEKLPVMVWIHGGGFTSGDGLQFGGTDGSDLARQGDVVVVSLNYRVGQFGFLAHPELTRDSGTSGNYGLLDQVAALEWVQDNIEEFGGDANNVTIFGESAGGWSVCLLLTSPLGEGLFQRAIVQSGICEQTLPTLAAAERQGLRFATDLRCEYGGPFEIDCLRRKSMAEVRATLPGDPNFAFTPGTWGTWFPVVDGEVVPKQPREALAAGEFHRVPVLIGATQDEGTLFVAMGHDYLGRPMTAQQYPERVASLIPDADKRAEVLARYPLSNYATPGAAMAELFGDGMLACPTLWAAEHFAAHVPTFTYLFTYSDAPFVFPMPVELGAYHSAEIQYIFSRRTGGPFNATEQALSADLLRRWTTFAATGNPNSEGQTTWPAYGPEQSYLRLDSPSQAASQPKADACRFWRDLDYQPAPLVDPREVLRRELDANRALWQANGPRHYRITARRGCFCPPPDAVRLDVRDGVVVASVDATTLEPVDDLWGFDTVEAAFERIDAALNGETNTIVVDYDPTYGHPIRIEIDYLRGAVDDELEMTLADLVPLSGE